MESNHSPCTAWRGNIAETARCRDAKRWRTCSDRGRSTIRPWLKPRPPASGSGESATPCCSIPSLRIIRAEPTYGTTGLTRWLLVAQHDKRRSVFSQWPEKSPLQPSSLMLARSGQLGHCFGPPRPAGKGSSSCASVRRRSGSTFGSAIKREIGEEDARRTEPGTTRQRVRRVVSGKFILKIQ